METDDPNKIYRERGGQKFYIYRAINGIHQNKIEHVNIFRRNKV